MTKQSKSGEEVQSKTHKSHKVEDHINQQFTTTDGKYGWFGQEVEVHSDPLIDSGSGKPVIIRMFEFAANPEILKQEKPTKQQLFDNHAAQIRSFLWRDGLQPYEGVSPKVSTSKKREKYRIFVACEPKPGVVLLERPKKLQDLTKPLNTSHGA